MRFLTEFVYIDMDGFNGVTALLSVSSQHKTKRKWYIKGGMSTKRLRHGLRDN